VPDSSTERIGRYQLLEPIGGGPNGAVWRAKVFGVAGFERQFAIKRFHPELTAAPSTAQALSAAARSYGSLEHPRIARMSEFGVAQGQTFTAVELVAGLDAARLVAEAKLGGSGLAAGGSLALVSQVARAVGYAHGRGLSHLGLAPSNVIVTVDGDVKVTDFGILASTMSAHPVEVPRLAARIGYIAPEQLVGEATSAATDVYVLGVIAYELVTGQRAYFGDTPQAVAQAILAGPPADPPLPRPIVRVLTRCLARSQFERFPDARAFADALDAALRVAPVPGTRKEVGAQVKAALDRHAAMNDGNLSGMVALPSQPTPPSADAQITSQLLRADLPVPRPAPLGMPRLPAVHDTTPSATLTEMPKPMMTMPGVVPPIPVPSGVGGLQPTPTPAPAPPAAQTILGISASKRPIPSAANRSPGVVPIVPPSSIPSIPRPGPGLKGTMDIPKISPALKGPVEPSPAGAPVARITPVPPASKPPAEPPEPTTEVTTEVTSGPHETATAPYALVDDDDDLPEMPDLLDVSVTLSPTDTSPAIQVIPGDDPVVPKARTASRDLPTGQMDPELVDELKRISSDRPYSGDPLVEMSLEAIGGGGSVVVEEPPRRATPPPRQRNTPPPMPVVRAPVSDGVSTVREGPSPLPKRGTGPVLEAPHNVHEEVTRESTLQRADLEPPPLGDGARARDVSPAQPRMPSPSPPSLVANEPAKTMIGVATPAPPPPHPVPSPASLATSGLAAADAPIPTTTPGMGPAVVPSVSFSSPSKPQAPARKRWPLVAALAVVAIGGGGVAAWQLMPSEPESVPPPHKIAVTTGSADAGSAAKKGSAAIATTAGSATAGSAAIATTAGSATAGSAAIATTGSASSSGSAAGTGSAAIAMTGSAASTGSAAKPAGTPTSDALQITSNPAGARVFIDGADQGVTPVKLAGTSDRHTMALLLAGHDLYVAEVDGHGSFSIPLTQITPPGGPAGIKVIKCKDKNRYYVFVDGKPTGQTCPTERIDCTTGPHTVEVYDVVTETRRKWDIVVTDTRLSFRVRIE